MMEVQHNVIPMVTTFVVQNGDFVGSLQNIVIARNVLTLGKVAPWISQKLKVCLVKILHRFLPLYVNVWSIYINDFILVTSEESNQVVRSDGRCGPTVPQSDGSPSECNPETEFFCCSKWGYCGSTDEHCDCADCVDYRKGSKGKFYIRFLFPFTLVCMFQYKKIFS